MPVCFISKIACVRQEKNRRNYKPSTKPQNRNNFKLGGSTSRGVTVKPTLFTFVMKPLLP